MTTSSQPAQPVSSSASRFIPGRENQLLLEAQQETAEQFSTPVYFSDTLSCGGHGPELAVIPAGHFEMGAAPDEHDHRKEETPQHYVRIGHPFAIGRYSVTAEEFERFRQATKWHLRPELIWAQGKKPVINIRISDAQLYLQWLSDESGETYRLPTEAEWEYAARAGTTTPFCFGNDVSCKEVHFDAFSPYRETHRKKWYLPRCLPTPASIAVGSKPANHWGLHEVHGNVWEFTASPWTHSHLNANRDGSADVHNHSPWIVTKGGSWFDGASKARSAARMRRHFDEMDTNLGFRVLRELG